MRVAALCGSLGPGSANAATLDVAAGVLRRGEHAVDQIRGLDAVPPFRADRVDDAPREVVEFRAAFEVADGVVIAAPEYAGGLAGVVKNALDWLVGSGSLYHKPVAVLSAGTTGGEHAVAQLVRTLSWQGALVVATLGISGVRTKVDGTGRIVDAGTIAAIEECVEHLVAAHAASADERLARVSEVVSRYGIDPARFGTLP